MSNLNFFTMSDQSIESEKTMGAKFPFTGLSYATENHLPPTPSKRGGVGGEISSRSVGEKMHHTYPVTERSRIQVTERSRIFALSCLLFFLFSTLSYGQLNWSGTQTLTNTQEINQNINLTGNVTINVASGWAKISGTISSSSNFTVTKTGSGTLILTGNNTYTGVTTISAGELLIGQSTSSGSISGNIVNYETLSINRSNEYTYSGVISGTGDVYLFSASSTTLNGINTYTGITHIYGPVVLGTNGSIASSSSVTLIDFPNASLDISSGNKTIKALNGVNASHKVILATRTLTIGTSIALPDGGGTFAGVISGTGSIIKTGLQTLNLTGNNTYTGTTTISAGTLSIGNNTETGAIVGNIVNNSHVVFNRSNNYTYSGVISGNGALGKQGAGILTLTGNNTYTSATTIYAGVLSIGNNSTTGAIVGDIVNSSTLRFYRSNDYTYSGVISGTGNVFQYAINSTLTLNGANTYTGITYIDAPLVLGTNGSIANSTSVTLNNYAVAILDVSSGNKTIKALNGVNAESQVILGSRTLTIGTSTTSLDGGGTFRGVISGTGGVVKTGTVSLYLTGNNTYTGTTTISAGNLSIGNNTPTGAITGNIVNNGHLIFNRLDDYVYSSIISGTGSVSKISSSDLDFLGNNTYTGVTTNSAGDLFIGYMTPTGAIAGDIVNNGRLIFSRTNEYTYSGVISGTGNVYHYSYDATLTLTEENTYTGFTAIYAPLVLGENGSIDNSAVIHFVSFNDFNIPKLDISSNNKTIKRIDITNTSFNKGEIILGSGTLTIGTSPTTADGGGEFQGVISGTGSIIKTGTEILTLSGNNTYTGATYIDGPLVLGVNGSIASSSSVNLRNYNTASLEISAENKTIKALNGENAASQVILGDKTLTIGTSTTSEDGGGEFAGIIEGYGELIKTGTETLYLTGNNTFTGTTTISAGSLSLGNNTESGYIAGDIVNNANLIFNRSINYTHYRAISGTGNVIKTGTNTLILTGNNTYTGTTTINKGSLYIGFDSTTGDIAGNIINNGNLKFLRSNDYTYSGVISGTGDVYQQSGALTMDGVNTYTGKTYINEGSHLLLGPNGSIASSASVNFKGYPGEKFDISAGNKTINALNSVFSNSEVILGSSTLTLRDGDFKGFFSGYGGSVSKIGSGIFTMNGDATNTATGTFSLNEGRLNMANRWQGNFTKEAGTTLEVIGNVGINGTLNLKGGDIFMDLTTEPQSKITVSGELSASNINTLNLTTQAVSNHELIKAGWGITSANPFTVAPIPGFNATLEANGTQLLLNATTTNIEQLGIRNYELSIYPNPTRGELRITNYELRDGVNIELFDVFGRCVETWRAASLQDGTINISHLPSGLYMLKVGNQIIKIVKT